MIFRSRITALRLHSVGVGIGVAMLVLAGCAVPSIGNSTLVVKASETDLLAATLESGTGEPTRGRDIVMGRDANCLLCHAIPETGVRFMGNLGPALSGVGARLTSAQLRERLIDPQRFNSDSIMPAYARTAQLTQVGKARRGKPILNAQQIEDAVAYLLTLR